MLVFCPFCGNLLFVEDVGGEHHFVCNICPVNYNIKKTKSSRSYYKLKVKVLSGKYLVMMIMRFRKLTMYWEAKKYGEM